MAESTGELSDLGLLAAIDDGLPLPPLADPVNAEIFSSKEQAGLAMQTLLNDVLEDSGDTRIGKIITLIPQKYKPAAQGRSYRIDVYAETADNELAVFEVSLDKNSVAVDRSFIYTQQAISQKLPVGVGWRDMPSAMPDRVIMLNILDFEARKGGRGFHQVCEVTYREPPRELATERFSAHNLELPKFRKTEVDFNKPLHCWLHMLCKAQDNHMTLREAVDSEPNLAAFAKREGVQQYMTQYAVASANPTTRNEYYLWAMHEMLENENMRLQRKEAREEGREEGRMENKVKTAKMMLASNMHLSMISSFTDLSEDEINALR
ncbi:MAG: Rpn family recombination-promoting nuclease/putative transposase [Oscillospiraceae bacterium]|jgi:predicted transposase/invertase (TIGR01784 family)|nr:Rpn family recombination-promoting nuclease/putative transposase [Oscillospiraceae bacterium]